MSILDKIFIGMLSTAILCVILGIIYFIASILTKKKETELKQKKVKNKKKRRLIKKRIQVFIKKKKKQMRLGICFCIVGLFFTSGALYMRYHQATNLGDRDSDGIVEGYYLLNETSQQLEAIELTENIEKTRKNIRELAAKLSSFGVRYADPRLSVEGQQLLNKYYSQMKELGLNLNNQSIESLKGKETYDIYMSDIKKGQMMQKKVFDYFKVNEGALQQKK